MKYTLVILLAAFLTSCITPYESEIPLSRKGDTDIDTALIGYWIAMNYDEDTTSHMMKITPIDEKRVHVDYVMLEDKPLWETGWSSYIAYQTHINGELYTNLKILDSKGTVSGDSYHFAKYRLENDSLHVYVLTKDFKEYFDKIKDFRKYIKKNQAEVDGHFEEFIQMKKATK